MRVMKILRNAPQLHRRRFELLHFHPHSRHCSQLALKELKTIIGWSQVYFIIKNAGIQVANNAPYAYQPILNQPFGYSYYGKPMNALPNPPPDKPPQVLPPSLSSLPTKDEITKSNKKTLDPNRSNNNGTFSNIDRTSVSKKKTPTDLAGNLATNDSLDKIEQIKNSLIKDLKDVDLVMETPSAAIFTLIIGKYMHIIEIKGMSLSLVLVIVLACKIRARRNFFGVKRNVMTDADGDYLVNGMYL
ncbi:unnamed protein product [Lepeophtheirus salmonis]|uniref:(salmon louse) hypothetical protein n=1 Tax=Lepeophtheirus salmonis TaxID=72036 RepID=A0A7R8D3A5_LEPSM|nr:unnamed protein product [Lepeophtheirus salmonis]CAF3014809.1 unnamed protein product [Lepeophtheirus salmonis]